MWRYGLKDMLRPSVNMIHGPGCPVCVLPIGRIDSAIELSRRPGLVLCTYADTMRVPASGGLSLLQAKARGGDIRMVYSSADALRIAREHPDLFAEERLHPGNVRPHQPRRIRLQVDDIGTFNALEPFDRYIPRVVEAEAHERQHERRAPG